MASKTVVLGWVGRVGKLFLEKHDGWKDALMSMRYGCLRVTGIISGPRR